MADIENSRQNGGVPDWQSTIGMFAGDEIMERICRAALEYREADRRRARRQAVTKRRRKP